MTESLRLTEDLKGCLLRVLHDPHAYRDLNRIIHVCHALALATLRHRMSGRYAGDLHGISHTQLAYDCIADLFERTDDDRLPKLSAYFGAFLLDEMSDEQVLQHFRRLAAGAVQQALVRLYSEIDPTLGKILRNVKLAVQSLQHFRQVDHFGETCLAPLSRESLDHLGVCPLEELVKGILAHAVKMHTVPDLLAALSVYLQGQSQYSRVVPVLDVARACRAVFAHLVETPDPVAADTSEHMERLDLEAAIVWACGKVQRKMVESYVRRGRIREDTLLMYRQTIEQYLRAKFDGEGDRASLRAHFQGLFPDISQPEYAQIHRARLEYMTRLAEQFLRERILS